MKILPLIPKAQLRPLRPAEQPGAGLRAGTPARAADVIRLSPDRGRPSQMAFEEALALLDQTTDQLSQGRGENLGRLHRLDGDQALDLLIKR
ncbi:MAG: hypothetical protein JRC92_02070 [Deltaproteobacteria bacterium]|nr:hypothetical protein [Deltaproteobacteria bacterium]